jgi:hypothetical protein
LVVKKKIEPQRPLRFTKEKPANCLVTHLLARGLRKNDNEGHGYCCD